jgi:hypothetical protein
MRRRRSAGHIRGRFSDDAQAAFLESARGIPALPGPSTSRWNHRPRPKVMGTGAEDHRP